ncbi:MAG: pyroglutamyl-peptidase I [Firmicutes bacterium]|nr:pyroglutamyl-peptidase I [Bacillota bacterium]
MKALITGFSPFGGEARNPSIDAVRMLPDAVRYSGGEIQIYKAEIPTAFGRAGDALCERLEKICPDIVICVGQAGGRKGISIEKVAINYIFASHPDNEGNKPEGVPVVSGAPDAYFSTLPVLEIESALFERGFSAKISYSAGTFVCNDLFYTLMHVTAGRGISAGFIHVPYSTEQAGERRVPSMPTAKISEALEIALAVSAEYLGACRK